METKTRYVLKHESGRYLSWSPDEFPLTKKLSRARRFHSTEDIGLFLRVSDYAPDKPEEYEIQAIKITYEEVNENGENGDLRSVS